jgi:hypothetical protein
MMFFNFFVFLFLVILDTFLNCNTHNKNQYKKTQNTDKILWSFKKLPGSSSNIYCYEKSCVEVILVKAHVQR